jgi:threonine dehydrogenase-like Zn-dependent dehydrogenase
VGISYGVSKAVVADDIESRLDFAKTYSTHDTYKMGTGSLESQADEMMKKKTTTRKRFGIVITATGAQPCI